MIGIIDLEEQANFSVPFFLGILTLPKALKHSIFGCNFVAHGVQEILNYTKITLMYSLFMVFLVDVNCFKTFNTKFILIPLL